MTTREMAWLVEQEVKKLASSLYEATSTGVQEAQTRCRGWKHETYPHFRPLVVRIGLREHLVATGLPPGWEIAGNPGLMGQVYLKHPELGVKLRFLKERRSTYPGGVPVAGKNPARRRAWEQPLPGLEVRRLRPEPEVEFLLLWDYVVTSLGEFRLRLVHTLEPGRYGQAVRCDVDVDIQPGGELIGDFQFRGGDDDPDLFGETEVEIDRSENGE
ncbi:hypothetical protein [Kocuria sp.]|uniref:hypothetical protein n=1 Tax=Kocuria sp. TaxID=1871328 RepID=UPI0026E0A981|nr:hypothetical protein [Kocuria sp.]MDO5619753.1 hypothetical protein [Kocuria sp.]